MTELQFRQLEPVSEIQWFIVLIICIVLVAVYLVSKNINRSNASSKNEVKRVNTTAVSKTAVIHEFNVGNKDYLVFESKYGVIELQGARKEEKEVSSNDS
ncbi:hypothetical protein [Pseudoalteromonas aurantia]|uniref:Uncharacterized protein n=1 Tax=Pseudoalteromonas aurantia TaxID=43654 RepID=A0A5S3V5S9_9GAMM|nr:hypothetical protein [Pseudoalteromonas aurantia]TMO66638.1 hypothetical protein CWC19_15855 [Pseudoalteromonas aurantia]